MRENVPVDGVALEMLSDLCCRLEISRAVKLVKSGLVQVPTVIGWLRPVILLPASTLSGLTPAQLEAILAHELAHVSRCDYLVNAAQCIVETLMFYHPVVWWISRCVREEREHCCDDLVVKVCGDRLAYAKALASLEGSRIGFRDFAFAAAGGSLLNRIRRLMGLPENQGASIGRQAAGLALIALGLLLLGFGIFALNEKPKYVAWARIKLDQKPAISVDATDGKLTLNGYDPYFMQTEFEIIQSDAVLEKAVAALNLNGKWGKKYGSQTLKTGDAVSLVRGRLDLRPIRNTSYLEIRVTDEDAQEAADLANAVASAYGELRNGQRQAGKQDELDILRKRMSEREEKVAAQQKVVDDLREKLGIPASVALGDAPVLMTAETLRKLESLRIENQAQYSKESRLWQALTNLSRSQLEQVLPTAASDTLLTSLLEQRSLAEQKLVQLKTDYGPGHPELVKTTELIKDLNSKITQRVDGIMLGLTQRVESLQKGLAHLEREVDSAKAEDIAIFARSRPYFDARQRLGELQRFNQVLAMKYATETIEAALPKSRVVEVFDQARAPLHAVSPNRPKASAMIVLGVALIGAGLLLCRSRTVPAAVALPV